MRWLAILAIFSCPTYGVDLLPDETRSAKKDALYGESIYELHSGNYTKALQLNTQLRKRKNGRHYGKVLDIQKAAAQLGLGMTRKANAGYQRLIDDKRLSFIPKEARAQAWFYLAKHYYDKGLWKHALKSIRKVEAKDLASKMEEEFHFYAATLELFAGQAKRADEHILAIDINSPWATYAFLNLAVSYTEQDVHISKVESAFNKALELTRNEGIPEQLADRINLMAGQFFYATGRGRSAIRHLKGVSLTGAYTPSALLTYGWALTEQWQYHDALQPWYMLKTAHSPLNQDVQETFIAIPHILEKLNAKVMALGAFEFATEQYDKIHKQLEASAKRLNTGEFIEPLLAQQVPDQWGSFEEIDLTLPNDPDNVYLKDVMGQGSFQGQLKTLRDIHVMRSQLYLNIDEIKAFEEIINIRRSEYNEVRKNKSLSKKTKALSKMEARHRKLLKSIDKAFGNIDGTGLASKEEQEHLAKFKSVKSHINNIRKMKSSLASRTYDKRLRRVKGVLMWELSERYAERKKKVSNSLAILKQKLRDAKKQLKASKLAFKGAPQSFKGFNKKLAKLKKKYKRQIAKLNKIYKRQREKVGSIVRADIKSRQQRVLEYSRQARLAVARLFDETSNKSRELAVEGVQQ